MASMEVKIPTSAVMPIAIIDEVITALNRCDFNDPIPWRIFSIKRDNFTELGIEGIQFELGRE
jgi:hypothetical protein